MKDKEEARGGQRAQGCPDSQVSRLERGSRLVTLRQWYKGDAAEHLVSMGRIKDF